MVFLFTSSYISQQIYLDNFSFNTLLRYSGLMVSVLDAGLSSMGSRGLFLEGSEKFSHPKSQQNRKPYDYRAVLFMFPRVCRIMLQK